MKELAIAILWTLLVLSESRPGVITSKKVSTKNDSPENHVRVRRHFDYEDFMSQFWDKWSRPCSDCEINNIGNGYKNWNTVHAVKRTKPQNHHRGTLNVGNGRKNNNTVYYGTGENSPNYDVVNIGNGSGNKNVFYYGAKPGSVNGDPFSGSFWND